MAQPAVVSPGAIPAPAACLELLKPITWFPPMWAFACGVVSTGVPIGAHWGSVALGIVLAGPLVCATSQAVNDWFDREVDAINEPDRPIPSGRVPGRWGLYLAIAWTVLSLVVGLALGRWVGAAAAVGLVLAWAYSAPPFRLKRNGWWGNAACAVCYEGLAWVTGAAVVLQGALPEARSLAVAALYSAGAHGIMTLNDFKSIDGDLRMGIGSLPARLGAKIAARVACVTMALPQFVVIGVLAAGEQLAYAGLVAVLLVLQLALMPRFLADPRGKAQWYSALGVSLYVLGMLVAALALRALVHTQP